MLLKINGPKRRFWQWDLDRQLIVDEDTCGEVHFCNGTTECTPVCKIYQKDGLRLVDVPNIFLQTARPLTAYLYRKGSDGQLTRHQQTFPVVARNKPDDYVYTETEVKRWDDLDERIRALEENGGGTVKSVNGVSPDEAGNVEIEVPAIDAEWMATKEDGGSGKTAIIPEQTVSNSGWSSLQMALEEGVAYAVEVNGSLYRCECRNDGDGTLYLGNGTLLGATAHNNEPFCIAWMGGTATAGMFYNDGTLSAPITLKVNDWEDDIYNKLPKEFLPDCVVKGDENGVLSWDDVSGKPFAEDAGELLFSHTATFATDNGSVKVTGASLSLDDGVEYWLEVNGDMIRCHCENASAGVRDLYDAAGNRWLRKNAFALFVYGQTAGTYTYNLYELSDDIVLDPKYIPNSIARKSDIPNKASAVADAAGETVTGAEFNALLAALREAGYLGT